MLTKDESLCLLLYIISIILGSCLECYRWMHSNPRRYGVYERVWSRKVHERHSYIPNFWRDKRYPSSLCCSHGYVLYFSCLFNVRICCFNIFIWCTILYIPWSGIQYASKAMAPVAKAMKSPFTNLGTLASFGTAYTITRLKR